MLDYYDICLFCKKNPIPPTNRHGKFCGLSCSAKFNNRLRTKPKNPCSNCKKPAKRKNQYCSSKCKSDFEYQVYIQSWKLGFEDGMRGEDNISGHIRRYLIEKSGGKCQECNWGVINKFTNKLPLNVDHIDGNYKNNKEENLRILCPNCHSLTPNYGSRNRGHGRMGRQRKRISLTTPA